MSTPFLERFSLALVDQLLAEQLLEIRAGTRLRVATHLAAHLAAVREGGQLLSEVDRGLITCDDVEELYADLDQIKAMVHELQP